MVTIAWDTETHLIAPGMLAPKGVVLSWAEGNQSGLILFPEAVEFLRRHLVDHQSTLVMHNGSYDLAVCAAEDASLLPLIFEAFDQKRLRDTMIRGMLIDIARGEFTMRRRQDGKSVHAGHSLAGMAQLYCGKKLEKVDTYRLRYNELDGVPLEKWPEEAKTYAIEDAVTTLEVFNAQEAFIEKDNLFAGDLPNEWQQTRAAFALHLMAVYGVRTDEKRVAELRARLEASLAEAHPFLKKEGLIRAAGPKRDPESKWSKDMAAIRERVRRGHEKLGLPVPLTATGAVSTSEEAKIESGDPVLIKMASFSTAEHLLDTYVPALERGTKVPINARWNVLLESGRTSCQNPNLQNPPAQDSSVRECFVPRPGYVFANADYSVIELRALAQICLDLFGFSKLAEAFRAGEDPHANLAKAMGLDPSKDAVFEINGKEVSVRRYCKAINFGLPGGMGAEKFVTHAGASGIELTLAQAEAIRRQWFQTWPEVYHYFNWIGRLVPNGTGTVKHLRSGRIRGGCRFTQAANTQFQGLVADGAKDALWLITKEAHTVPRSSSGGTPHLFGTRPVLFLHDELILEVPEDRSTEAANRMVELMIEGMQPWMPDVPVAVGKPTLMRRWSKAAKSDLVDGKWKVWE